MANRGYVLEKIYCRTDRAPEVTVSERGKAHRTAFRRNAVLWAFGLAIGIVSWFASKYQLVFMIPPGCSQSSAAKTDFDTTGP